MKELFVVALILFGTQFVRAQFFKNTFYYEGEIGSIVSFFVEDVAGERHVVTFGGVNFRGGIGVHDEDDIIFLGIYSGMEGYIRHDTGILPVYLNSRIGIPFSENDRLYFGFGYGKSFQIGPENFKGILHKYTIALSTKTKGENRTSYFLEIVNHGFNFPDDVPAISLNVGFTYTFE